MNGIDIFTAAVGFDGYVDRIARVVNGSSLGTTTYFDDIKAFSTELSRMAGLSGDLDYVSGGE